MPISNALLVRTAYGWDEVTDPDSVADRGRREALYGLGAYSDPASVQTIGRSRLAVISKPRYQLTAEHFPMTLAELAYHGFGTLDYLDVTADGGDPVSEAVVALAAGEDGVGNATVTVTLNDVVLWASPLENFVALAAQTLRKMVPGTGGGAWAETQPVTPPFIAPPVPTYGGSGPASPRFSLIGSGTFTSVGAGRQNIGDFTIPPSPSYDPVLSQYSPVYIMAVQIVSPGTGAAAGGTILYAGGTTSSLPGPSGQFGFESKTAVAVIDPTIPYSGPIYFDPVPASTGTNYYAWALIRIDNIGYGPIGSIGNAGGGNSYDFAGDGHYAAITPPRTADAPLPDERPLPGLGLLVIAHSTADNAFNPPPYWNWGDTYTQTFTWEGLVARNGQPQIVNPIGSAFLNIAWFPSAGQGSVDDGITYAADIVASGGAPHHKYTSWSALWVRGHGG